MGLLNLLFIYSMKKILLPLLLSFPILMVAEDLNVSSPDGNLKVTLSDNDGKLS